MSSESPAATPPPTTGPDWDKIEEEILCPLCDYNLRGLIEPRCPECGYRFLWEELINPAERLHPYLFEHHPERNAWSFWRTLTATLQPRRFWKALHPAQPSFPRRLVFYWALSALPMVLSAAANFAGLATEVRRSNQIARTWEERWLKLPQNAAFIKSAIQEYGSVDAYLDKTYPVTWRSVFRAVGDYSLSSLFIPAGVAVVWPWGTLAGLLVFQISMRRARVRRAHVLRCVCYSADIFFWLGIAMIPFAVSLPIYLSTTPRLMMVTLTMSIQYEMLGCAAAILTLGFRLWMAYRSYLRFQRSLLVVIASQIVAALIAINLLILAVWL